MIVVVPNLSWGIIACLLFCLAFWVLVIWGAVQVIP